MQRHSFDHGTHGIRGKNGTRIFPCVPRIPWLGVLFVAFSCASTLASAQSYPIRPVRIIVSVAAGGGTDTVGRSLAQKLTERLGQQFVIDNRPGGGGSIAVELTARANPNGHTVLFSSSIFVTNQLLYRVNLTH